MKIRKKQIERARKTQRSLVLIKVLLQQNHHLNYIWKTFKLLTFTFLIFGNHNLRHDDAFKYFSNYF